MGKIIRRTIKTVILIPAILILAIIAAFFISPVLNNITLRHFSKQLYNYNLPEKTETIEKKLLCGKLNGNGNGMDYFACMVVKSDLSMEDIKQYYSSATFKPAKTSSNHAVDVDVIKLNGKKLESEYVENQNINFELKVGEDYSKYYVVMIYDGGYSSGFDLRGH